MKRNTPAIENRIDEPSKKVEANPDDFDSICDLIEAFIESGSIRDLGEALSMVRREKERFKDKPRIQKLASMLYMRMEGAEEVKNLAIEAAEKFRELDKENATSYVHLGYVYWRYDELDKAIAITEQGLDIAERVRDTESLMYAKANLAYFYFRHKSNISNPRLPQAQSWRIKGKAK